MNTQENDFLKPEETNTVDEKEFAPLYKIYLKILKIKPYVIVAIIIFIAGILFYNTAIAGKSYPIKEYNQIKNVFAIFSFSLIAIIAILVTLIFHFKYKIRNKIKVIAQKHAVTPQDLIDDFNTIVKHHFGGEGA